MWDKLNKNLTPKAIIAILITPMMLGAIIAPLITHYETSTPEIKTAQTTELQTWVSETYFIDLTNEQAEYLIQHQEDDTHPKEKGEKIRYYEPVTVKDAYGKKQTIKLVKVSEKEWKLTTTTDLPQVKPATTDGKQK